MRLRSPITNLDATSVRILSGDDLRLLSRGKAIVAADGNDLAATTEGRALVRAEMLRRRKVRALVADAKSGAISATEKGRELAREMSKHGYIGDYTVSDAFARLASLLGRLAPEYERIQVRYCNGESYRGDERRERAIEARASVIVDAMAEIAGVRLSPVFGGDPRGYTLKIKVPDAPHDGNTWGRGGEYGVRP